MLNKIVKLVTNVAEDGFGNDVQVDGRLIALYETNAPNEILKEGRQFAEAKVIEEDPNDMFDYGEEYDAFVEYLTKFLDRLGFYFTPVEEEVYDLLTDINRSY